MSDRLTAAQADDITRARALLSADDDGPDALAWLLTTWGGVEINPAAPYAAAFGAAEGVIDRLLDIIDQLTGGNQS